MKPTIQLFFSLALALAAVVIADKIVSGTIIPQPTPGGLLSMEVAALTLLFTSYLLVEIRALLKREKIELRFRHIFYILFAVLGSGAVYGMLIIFLRATSVFLPA